MSEVWTTKDGRQIPVDQMEDRHLCNTINMLKRVTSACNWSDGLQLMHFSNFVHGEAAQDAVDFEMDMIDRRTPEDIFPIFKTMVKEAQSRKLPYERWCTRCQRFHETGQEKCVEVFCKRCRKWHPAPTNTFHQKALKCGKGAIP